MKTPKNILQHEFIGSWLEIVDAKNKALVGLRGEVVDETKYTFVLKTPNGEKRVLKRGVQFLATTDAQHVVVAGDQLVGRPEDRIKK